MALQLKSLPVWSLPAGLAAVLLAYCVIGAIVNHRKLRQFGGPPFASFSRFWLFWEEIHARVSESQHAAILKYGSPARIGPNLLCTDDSDLVRHMNAPGSKWTRSRWYEGMKLDPRQDNVFSTRDEKLHAELKAKETGGYNGRDIPTLESDIDTRVNDMVYLIKNSYRGKAMDMCDISRFFTMDVLSTVAFGRPFGFMAANEDLWDFSKMAAEFVPVLALQLNHAFFGSILTHPITQALAAPKVTDKKGWGRALAFARQAVAERYGSNAKIKKDMLGSFVDKGLDQTQCEVESFLQILAGSDSTTDALRSTMFLLASNPGAYANLKAEVDTTANPDAASEEVIKYTDSLKLPYLKASIWEAIRLFPPLFGLKSKCAPQGGETFKGVYFPEGSEVCICDDALMRRPEVFGEDINLYRPERFLEGDDTLQMKRFRAVEVVFGSGRFLCLGRHIASMELNKAVFELIRHFDFALAYPTKGVPMAGHGIRLASKMMMVARARK